MVRAIYVCENVAKKCALVGCGKLKIKKKLMINEQPPVHSRKSSEKVAMERLKNFD